MYVLIVGGGKVGESLARALSQSSYDVALVEKEESFAKRIAEEVDKILVIAGDGCDPAKLEDAGINRAQVLAAVTGDDEDNLIICQLARDTFGVPRVIARVNNPRNEITFQKLGIDTVSSTTIITKLIEEEATIGDIFTLLALKRGKLSIVEAILKPKSPAVNKTIKELNLIICQLARDTFGVPRVIARVNNPRNEITFQKLGIDTVSSTTIITKLIEEEATIGDIFTLLALKRGKLSIVEAHLKTKSPAVNKTIKELNLPGDAILATIVRENQIIFPKGETVLLAGDQLIALSTIEQEKNLRDALLGKE